MHKFNTHAIIQSILYHIEVMLEEYPRARNICPYSFCSSRLLHYVQGTISVKEKKFRFFQNPYSYTQFTSIELFVQHMGTLSD